MFINNKRYIKTDTGRIFKCDGYVPILELVGGTWIRPKDFSHEYLTKADELNETEANGSALCSDEEIETDNVAPVLCFYETIVASTSFKYGLLLNDLDLLRVSPDYSNDQFIFAIWLDCAISSLAVWARNDVFPAHFDNWGNEIVNLVAGNMIPGLAKKLFPGLKMAREEIVELSNKALEEFNRALNHIGRVERLFLTIMNSRSTSKYNDFFRASACLVNRFFDRCHGLKEEDLRYDETAPLVIYDGEHHTMWVHLMNHTLGESVRFDNKLFDTLKSGFSEEAKSFFDSLPSEAHIGGTRE